MYNFQPTVKFSPNLLGSHKNQCQRRNQQTPSDLVKGQKDDPESGDLLRMFGNDEQTAFHVLGQNVSAEVMDGLGAAKQLESVSAVDFHDCKLIRGEVRFIIRI